MNLTPVAFVGASEVKAVQIADANEGDGGVLYAAVTHTHRRCSHSKADREHQQHHPCYGNSCDRSDGGGQLGIISTSEALALAEQRSSIWSRCRRSAGAAGLPDHGLWQVQVSAEQETAGGHARSRSMSRSRKSSCAPRPMTTTWSSRSRHVRRFLEEGNKAKVTLVFRGREMTHMEYRTRRDREICCGTRRYCRDRSTSPHGWSSDVHDRGPQKIE